jgi:hypothetical protein
MAGDCEIVTAHLVDVLLSSRNGDGGWAYVPGKVSRLEPTCWALLALVDGTDQSTNDRLLRSAWTLLSHWQQPDGLLLDVPGALPNVAFNGLAAVVLRHLLTARSTVLSRDGADVERRLLRRIVTLQGVRTRRSTLHRQNNRLIGWPWVHGTFSWVEPTTWCLLALKKARPVLTEPVGANRVNEAERLLVDRCCLSGGWNYGNSNVLGKELYPYVPSTALSLLSLRDRRDLPEVARSLEWLRLNRARETSSMALSLALTALAAYGEPIDDLEAAITGHIAKAGLPVNLATAALTAYALGGARHGFDALAA